MTQSQSHVRKPGVYSPEWGSDVVSYAHTPNLPEYYRTYQPHGLVFQGIWVVANVMDEAGDKYNLFRQYKASDTTMTVSSKVVPGLESTPEPLFQPGEMFLGRCSHEIDLEQGFIEVKPFLMNPNAFNIKVRPQLVEWKDGNGRIDLTFKALGPALEYYCPGQWEDGMYRTEPCEVTGTFDGKLVSGFGVIDVAWGPAGVDFTQGKIFRLLEEHWVIWMNEYEDGSKDCGVYLDGTDRFAAGYYNLDGRVTVSRQNSMEVGLSPSGFLQSANFSLDDLRFEFTSEAKVQQVPSFVSWASGRVTRVGETRKAVRSFSWFEFFPKK